MNHSRSLLRENSFPRKKIVKIKILQTNLQFGDFLRENHEFYYTCVACSGIKNVIKKTYCIENLVLFFRCRSASFWQFFMLNLKAYFLYIANNRITILLPHGPWVLQKYHPLALHLWMVSLTPPAGPYGIIIIPI